MSNQLDEHISHRNFEFQLRTRRSAPDTVETTLILGGDVIDTHICKGQDYQMPTVLQNCHRRMEQKLVDGHYDKFIEDEGGPYVTAFPRLNRKKRGVEDLRFDQRPEELRVPQATVDVGLVERTEPFFSLATPSTPTIEIVGPDEGHRRFMDWAREHGLEAILYVPDQNSGWKAIEEPTDSRLLDVDRLAEFLGDCESWAPCSSIMIADEQVLAIVADRCVRIVVALETKELGLAISKGRQFMGAFSGEELSCSDRPSSLASG